MAELVSGQITSLSSRVKRLLAPNPGPFTGAGTNTYIVGNDAVAVIDPGPLIDSHIDKILNEAAERIRWIILTHTHVDHSPAAAVLKERLGAQVEVLGMPSKQQGLSFDGQFKADRVLGHDDVIQNNEFTLRAIFTPGHAANHLCYFFEEEQWLFCGDQLMEGSTVIIAPPDGNMADYIQSLELLLSYPISTIAPAHGNLMPDAHAVIRHTIKHRLKREEKVLIALRENGALAMNELVARVYDDVPVFMHLLASQSLLAHLQKLEAEGRVRQQAEQWLLV